MLRYKNSVMNRKKYQREVNRIVRKWIQSIKNDWLWNGRFVLRQYAAYFWPFEDKSGAEFSVWLEFTDIAKQLSRNRSFLLRIVFDFLLQCAEISL